MNNLSNTATANARALVRVQGQSVQVGRNTTWRGLVATFIAGQDVRESSRSQYTRTVSQFFVWMLNTGRNFNALTDTDVLEYKDYLFERGSSPLTVGSYIVAVRKFFSWCEAGGYHADIAKGVKTPKKSQVFKKEELEEDECAELLRHFDGVSPRDFAMVNLMLRTGLRTIEVIRANVGDITYKGGRRVLKVWGKGRDDRSDFVVLSDKAYEPVSRYLETRGAVRMNEPLFVSESNNNRGGRLTTRTVSKTCKEGLKAIGLDGREYTAHSLRHTAAAAILNHNGTIADVQAVLRHTNPATSQIYAKRMQERRRLRDAPELLIDAAF